MQFSNPMVDLRLNNIEKVILNGLEKIAIDAPAIGTSFQLTGQKVLMSSAGITLELERTDLQYGNYLSYSKKFGDDVGYVLTIRNPKKGTTYLAFDMDGDILATRRSQS